MNNFIKFFLTVVFCLWIIYLLLPAPREVPALPNSVKSTEPGDTVQIPGISAYYTNLSRQEVMDFYSENFSHSNFLDIPLFTYRLNHPPEYVKILIDRNTQRGSYLEEVTHLFRESLFVSGFEWENDPFTKPGARVANKLWFNGQEYKAKVTIFTRESKPIFRFLVTLGIAIYMFWLIFEIKGFYKSIRSNTNN